MAVPDGRQFPMEFDEVFPEGASVVGKAMAVRESQSPDDTARNRTPGCADTRSVAA